METLGQGVPGSTAKKKQRRRTIKERRDTVEETLVPGASVAQTPNTTMNAAKVCWRFMMPPSLLRAVRRASRFLTICLCYEHEKS
jgi:hypothetical protein